jgi:hypothetical protein
VPKDPQLKTVSDLFSRLAAPGWECLKLVSRENELSHATKIEELPAGEELTVVRTVRSVSFFEPEWKELREYHKRKNLEKGLFGTNSQSANLDKLEEFLCGIFSTLSPEILGRYKTLKQTVTFKRTADITLLGGGVILNILGVKVLVHDQGTVFLDGSCEFELPHMRFADTIRRPNGTKYQVDLDNIRVEQKLTYGLLLTLVDGTVIARQELGLSKIVLHAVPQGEEVLPEINFPSTSLSLGNVLYYDDTFLIFVNEPTDFEVYDQGVGKIKKLVLCIELPNLKVWAYSLTDLFDTLKQDQIGDEASKGRMLPLNDGVIVGSSELAGKLCITTKVYIRYDPRLEGL